jgi:hypothetical protein
MRRILLVFSVAALMAVMMALGAGTAFAAKSVPARHMAKPVDVLLEGAAPLGCGTPLFTHPRALILGNPEILSGARRLTTS